MNRLPYLAFLFLAGFLFLALVQLAEADWRSCFHDAPIQVAPLNNWLRFDLRMAWVYWLPTVPLLFLVLGRTSPDRPAWAAAVLLACLGAWLLFPGSKLHDCDRKGTDAVLAVLLLFPASATLALLAGLFRAMVSRPV
jgi:hypothetical protein